MKKLLVILVLAALFMSGCEEIASGAKQDNRKTLEIGNKLAFNQPTPTDIDYSLERYNLIRRTYWVNGQREKAINLPCPIVKPFGYIILFTEQGAVVGNFVVDGKVSALSNFLTPNSEYYEITSSSYRENKWLPDVDGTYGLNDVSGIFFFTPDGKYIEWTGDYLYSDIPIKVNNPIIKMEVTK